MSNKWMRSLLADFVRNEVGEFGESGNMFSLLDIGNDYRSNFNTLGDLTIFDILLSHDFWVGVSKYNKNDVFNRDVCLKIAELHDTDEHKDIKTWVSLLETFADTSFTYSGIKCNPSMPVELLVVMSKIIDGGTGRSDLELSLTTVLKAKNKFKGL